MIIEDFSYMWCGREIKPLQKSDANLLQSISLHNQNNGKAILLLHGFSSSPAVYREFFPALKDYDAIYCPILPGHADCIEAFSNATAEQWLNCSYNAYLSLATNYKTIDVLGLSLGGLLALSVSHKFPVNHLYLLAPALKLRGSIRAFLFAAYLLRFMGLSNIKNRGGNLRFDKFQEITYKKIPINSLIQVLSLIKKFYFSPPICPTDLFLGRFDEVVDSNAVADLFSNSSFTKVHWLDNSAHVLPLDADYAKIVTLLQTNI
jgi:carboxylesterase